MAKKKENQLMFKVVGKEAKIVPQKHKKVKFEDNFTPAKPGKIEKQEPKQLPSKAKTASWFRLDNAATIYPASGKEHWTFVFRVSAVMKDKVDPSVLQKTVTEIMPRFPTFDVHLKRGLFWYYFEHSNKPLVVEQEVNFPCSFMDLSDSKRHLVRVLFSDYRISVEVFHSITDGRGATMFLNSLIARYIENLGATLSSDDGILKHLDFPRQEEIEDSFFANATNEKGPGHREKPAYKIAGTIEDEGIVNSTLGIMSVKQVKEIAKKFNANISIFLVSCLAKAILKRKKDAKRPVKISLPIDLRSFFGSATLRNFSSYINIPLESADDTLEKIIAKVSAEFAKINKEYLQKSINSNVDIQKNWLIKVMPLCVKNFFLNNAFNFLGERLQTCAFSNIGLVKTPPEFKKYVDRFEVNLGRSKHNAISVGLISFEDTMVLTISSKLCENTTERDFFRILSELGVNLKIECNRRDEYGG